MHHEINTSNFKFTTFEFYTLAITSILAGIDLFTIAILGPIGIGKIEYKTSTSAIYQTIGQDLANIIFLGPVCILTGITLLMRKDWNKYLMILTPLYLFYNGLAYGIGMEWSKDEYIGNSQNYFFLFLFLMISGIILLLGSLSQFSANDTPKFKSRSLKIYCTLLFTFLILFAKIWLDEIFIVIQQGDTLNGSYQNSPTIFWVIRFLDLGLSIPLGFIAVYFLWSRPKNAFPVIQLFYGFFISMTVAVNMMGYSMLYFHDTEIDINGLIIFAMLGILSFSGYYYIMKDKLQNIQLINFIKKTNID